MKNVSDITSIIDELEKILTEYKKCQAERKTLLGNGKTDKRFVVQKAKMLDERLVQLRLQWSERIEAIDPELGKMYKRTSPTDKSINAIKQCICND